ncbi:MAG: cytochrome c peroxidase [Pseudomonadota bacterium]
MRLRRFGTALSAVLVLVSAVFTSPEAAAGNLLLDDGQIAEVIRHGPWPPAARQDPSNRVSGSAAAIAFGKVLFFDGRLSSNGKIACSSCHDPQRGWTDGLAKAGGLGRLDRNTQSLFNVGANRWFGWAGRNDSLWAHSIGPILDAKEMGMTAEKVADVVRSDRNLSDAYSRTFSREAAGVAPTELLVDVAKALAAFQETIVSDPTAFDRFRDALARGDRAAAGEYPAAAQRGAAIFVGRGNCNLCHLGPRFTNEEFDDAGVPYFTGPGRVDRGRHGGIAKLKSSPFNLLGKYNDAPDRATGWATRHVARNHRTFGQFKVPSLRQLTHTGPYMHDGSLRTIEEVVRHYSTIDLDRIHSDGVQLLRPLGLSEQEVGDLTEFLKSLSTPARGQ